MERERNDDSRSTDRKHSPREPRRDDHAAPVKPGKAEPLEIDLWPFGANRGSGGFGGGRH